MDPVPFVYELIDGNYVLVEDYYHNGLQILKELKKVLEQEYNRQTFQEQRKYRAVYREASHHLLLEVVDNRLRVKKSPNIGWLRQLYPEHRDFFISFPEVQGLNSSWQWYINGLDIDILDLTIKPFYGIYFPTRFDHLYLFDEWLQNYNGEKSTAIDVGVGSGVLSFQLLQHGFKKVVGTDINRNAIIGTREEADRLGFSDRLTLKHGDLFADWNMKVELIVFNPPWIEAKYEPESGIDTAIYYEDDLFPRFFKQAKEHLQKNGKLILLFSNLGEVVGENENHPIRKELREHSRFSKQRYMRRNVQSSSQKTQRKDFRKDEFVELWVLTHKNDG